LAHIHPPLVAFSDPSQATITARGVTQSRSRRPILVQARQQWRKATRPRRGRPCILSRCRLRCFSERYQHPNVVVEKHNRRVKQMPVAPIHPEPSPSCSSWIRRSPPSLPPHKKPGGWGRSRYTCRLMPLLVLTMYSVFTRGLSYLLFWLPHRWASTLCTSCGGLH
jgi:hypothetical protein